MRLSLGNQDGEAVLSPDLDTARKLIAALQAHAARLSAGGHPAVLLTPPDLRKPLFEFASRFVADLQVICARELTPGTSIEPAGALGLQEARAA